MNLESHQKTVSPFILNDSIGFRLGASNG
ncbi:hypothetical protein PRIPAC_95118, partial [Pristionchus pacificus]